MLWIINYYVLSIEVTLFLNSMVNLKFCSSLIIKMWPIRMVYNLIVTGSQISFVCKKIFINGKSNK